MMDVQMIAVTRIPIALGWGLVVALCTLNPAHSQDTTTIDGVNLSGDGYFFAQTEAHASFLSDAPDRSVFAASRGGAIRGGYRWDRWGVFGHIEQNRWLTSEVERSLTQGVLNIGVGGDIRFFDDRIRASVTTGTSTLLFDTLLDDAGTTGIFIDLRPGGLRWFPLEWLVLEFHPLSYSVMAPVMTTPQLVHIAYRSVFIMEFQL
ncbi:MAG: hypothetical protein AAFX99_07755 [Myxococcota bacterium]